VIRIVARFIEAIKRTIARVPNETAGSDIRARLSHTGRVSRRSVEKRSAIGAAR
jgi:hypothetical protein